MVRWAHCPGLQSYQLAPPVWLSAAAAGIGDAALGGAVAGGAATGGVVVRGFGAAVTRGAVLVGRDVGRERARVDERPGSVVGLTLTRLVGRGTGTESVEAAVVATSMASALTASIDAARAAVCQRLSNTRKGSASTVNQTANSKRRLGTTYGCRTSSAWASR